MASESATMKEKEEDYWSSTTKKPLSIALAKYTTDLSCKFTAKRGVFTVVISSGSLVKRPKFCLGCRKLVEAPYADSIEWGKWYLFWIDERVVLKDHPDSNYKLAYDGFLFQPWRGSLDAAATRVYGMWK